MKKTFSTTLKLTSKHVLLLWISRQCVQKNTVSRHHKSRAEGGQRRAAMLSWLVWTTSFVFIVRTDTPSHAREDKCGLKRNKHANIGVNIIGQVCHTTRNTRSLPAHHCVRAKNNRWQRNRRTQPLEHTKTPTQQQPRAQPRPT